MGTVITPDYEAENPEMKSIRSMFPLFSVLVLIRRDSVVGAEEKSLKLALSRLDSVQRN